ncbi:MAG: ABC transporter ATP-binding protein [Chloroflexi bacterium]|nr:ABC transporter ATP-binding protein [Chloroflexota bacterium]
MSVNSAIVVADLTKKFARTAGYRDLLPFKHRQIVTAVDGVSFQIGDGELFGLLGPNGAGKTTLIKLLCGLVLPNSGTATIFGHDIVREEQEVRKLVGLVTAEERSFFWRLTGRENLQFFASLYHLSREQAKRRINELLKLVGLEDKGDVRYQNYSTGMRQKLAIARSFLGEPRVLFVDEPTRSLDPVSAQTIRRFLKERVVGAGKTVVLATHNLNEAEQLCDRLAIMREGRVMAIGSVPELRSRFQKQESCQLQARQVSEDVLNRLRDIEGVQQCQIAGRDDGVATIEITMRDRSAVLPQVMQVMVYGGAEICNCSLKEAPLEDIFAQALQTQAAMGKN